MQRFGRDSVIALATTADGQPFVRYVNAYFSDGSFYVITHANSGKMRQICVNPCVGLAGEWMTGHGIARNLGWFGDEAHAALARTLRREFSSWIDNGHNNFSDRNTILLEIRLTDCVVYDHGQRLEWKNAL